MITFPEGGIVLYLVSVSVSHCPGSPGGSTSLHWEPMLWLSSF